MAKYMSLYCCTEELYDQNGNLTGEFKTNLPHSEEIAKQFCERWNEDADNFMLDLVNKECDDRIESCYMRLFGSRSGKTILCVEFVAKPQKSLTEAIKGVIREFMDSQYSDGWGEGMFGVPITCRMAQVTACSRTDFG